MKQITRSDARYTLHHYQDKDQDEVDIIVEDEQDALVGIEVKASATVHASDFKGMRKLLDSYWAFRFSSCHAATMD
jgi:hypothetical protein